jgi:hypothetical protein
MPLVLQPHRQRNAWQDTDTTVQAHPERFNIMFVIEANQYLYLSVFAPKAEDPRKIL